VVEERELHGAYPHTMREGTFSVGGMRMHVRCAGGLHREQLEGALLPANGDSALAVESCLLEIWDSEESGVAPVVDGWMEGADLRPGGQGEALGFLPGGELRYAGPDFDLRLDRSRPHIVDREESLATAIRPAKAASELLRNALSATPERIAGCFTTLTNLVTSVPVYTLEVGHDPASLAATVEALT
jgi:hypothetical protein